MKKILCLAVGLLALQLVPVFGQVGTITLTSGFSSPSPTNLTKFNLDFPGGTPAELVAAIEKATGKPLNVIIPDEDTDTKLPPLKMDDVDVAQLFDALEQASLTQTAHFTSPRFSAYSVFNGGYGFKTTGTPTDSSIWYFHVDKLVAPPEVPVQKIVKFYPLTPYLNSGLTVDDITTAIQTGWKMSGDNSPPKLNYHKETKLLMAYGEPDKLKVIDDVLAALQPTPENPFARFQQRLQNEFNKSQRPAAIPPHLAPPPNASAPLSPEAQVILLEQQRRQSTNAPAEKSGK